MKNKGYTLIELLGVMIILALLISFVLPSVINSIKSSSNKKDNLTNELIINAVKLYIEDNSDEYYEIYGNTYCIPLVTLVESNYLKSPLNLGDEEDITDLKTVKVSYTNKYSYEIVDNNMCTEKLITYNNGQDIYFDVEKGTGCTKEEYESSYDATTGDHLNSKTGYNGITNKNELNEITEKLEKQNSCLKFYVFNNDSKSKKVNLLLDHNTTTTVKWKSGYDNTSGPKEVIEQLKIDTDFWKGTEIPQNYTVSQGEGFANYIIDYSNYKARLITAGEIANITVNQTFDESISNFTSTYYFDSNNSSPSETCTEGNITGCKYGWLYDRTNSTCGTYGCLNNSDIEMYGYWTSTSSAKGNTRAWYIYYFGNIIGDGISIPDSCGVRPVIEVLKTNL